MKNGKMSLSSVEGVADLINSETNEQRRQALRQLSGKTGLFSFILWLEICHNFFIEIDSEEKIYLKWSQTLSKLYASIEAIIDFGEDEMINIQIVEEVYKEVMQQFSSAKYCLINVYDLDTSFKIRNRFTLKRWKSW